MLIRIYMKSGNVLPDFPCDEFTVQRSNLTGEITGYQYKGGMIPRPIHCEVDQIEAICRVDTEPMPDSNLVDELKAELAAAMEHITAQKDCTTCAHNFNVKDCGDYFCHNCPTKNCPCSSCCGYSNWKWRGAHESV